MKTKTVVLTGPQIAVILSEHVQMNHGGIVVARDFNVEAKPAGGNKIEVSIKDAIFTVEVPEPHRDWLDVEIDRANIDHFSYIRLEFPRQLDGQEIRNAAGCLGYALQQHMRTENMDDPEILVNNSRRTVLEFYCDSTKSRRDDNYAPEAFDSAFEYIVDGSPIRTTNRAGAGTRGTRLVNGIGADRAQGLRIFVS